MNMGFGVFPDGSPILPKYDPMLDDPRRHSLYFDRAVIRFFKQFKAGVPLNEEPAYVRMIQCGFYDGLGTMLPLGVYWHERIISQSFQLWSIKSCFDMFPYERLVNWYSDDQLRAYHHALQIDRYNDSAKAFLDYLKLRSDPEYVVEHELPSYMIDGDGLIIDYPKDDPFRPKMGGWWTDADRQRDLDALADTDTVDFDIL